MGLPMAILNGEWRAFIRVDDLQKGLAFYGDLLGLPAEEVTGNYVDFPGLSLTLRKDAPLEFHVDNFAQAALQLREANVEIYEEGEHQGKVRDPFGNLIGLDDHREDDESPPP